jgi:multiple sugar transport system permease protein
MKSFFDEIPQDLIDAARMDGANAAQVLTKIILPLSGPVLAVITIFTVIGSWKDFFWPYLVLMGREDLTPIMVALFRLTNIQSYPQPINIVMAGLAIASTPPIILFLIFQKQIMRGIVLTGLKG